jgi:hypothetical protein
MPSDERITRALEALGEAKETFVSSVAISAEEVRGILERDQGADEKPQEKLAHELGPFAAGRIDLERLAPFVEGNEKLDSEARDRVQKAYEVLLDLKKAGDDLFHTKVDVDGYLRGGIVSVLAKAGTAFGAARCVEWALHDIAPMDTSKDVLESFPPTMWNRAEKSCSPPVVVEVDGQDLKVGSIGELMSGNQKVVLVVSGKAAPAPLVRLITPGVTVVQTDDPAELAALGANEGPGVAALMPEGCAKFIHSPKAGRSMSDRLTVSFLPEEEPTRPLGTITAFQQAEELKQLTALAASEEKAPDAEVEAAGDGPPPMDEAGQLASWLISQADVAEV